MIDPYRHVCRVWPEEVPVSRLAGATAAAGGDRIRVRVGPPPHTRRQSIIRLLTSACDIAGRVIALRKGDNEGVTDEGIRQGRTRVATADHHVVGFATTVHAGRVLELEDLFADPNWMRRGVGHRLVRDVVAVAEREHVQRVEVTANPHAPAFYERVGFVHDGEVETRFGAGARMHLDA
jgi:N-acetylglutamate synthase-like GNAT family acetyltransferase